MISVDIKNETTKSPLNLSRTGEEPRVSFSDLLKDIKLPKEDNKAVQNGSLVLTFDKDEVKLPNLENKTNNKINTLISLLKSEEKTPVKKEEVLELNPKLISNLNPKEIKNLINDAKNYLKSKILESEDYKKSQIKDLPKTLKGLAQLAKKFDIDVSKITLQEVKTKDIKTKIETKNIKPLVEDIKTQTQDAKPLLEAKDIKTKIETKNIKPIVEDIKTTAKDIKPVVEPKKIVTKIKIQEKIEVKISKNDTEIKDTKILAKSQPNVGKKVEVENSKIEVKLPEIKTLIKTQKLNLQSSEQKMDLKAEKENIKLKEIKSIPIFKTQKIVEIASTEQIVQTKANIQIKPDIKTAKEKADETLKLLLRADRPSNNSSLTADFSVSTAKVIAPSSSMQTQKNLESLLRSDSSSSDNQDSSIKTEQLTNLKADSFEVKLNEAKQMIKYISQDVKTAIEDYKSPFSRVKIQLNPKNLGEIDVTIVQRGKNLHINLNSNNAAINTLNMNVNELKTQLSNNGINNATLNFSNNSQNGENSSQQQHRQESQKQANEEYKYFDIEESNEDILSSLEIIIPQYG